MRIHQNTSTTRKRVSPETLLPAPRAGRNSPAARLNALLDWLVRHVLLWRRWTTSVIERAGCPFAGSRFMRKSVVEGTVGFFRKRLISFLMNNYCNSHCLYCPYCKYKRTYFRSSRRDCKKNDISYSIYVFTPITTICLKIRCEMQRYAIKNKK